MLYRHILQQPLVFVLCVKILHKTYQNYLWAKLREQQLLMTASFLGTIDLSRSQPCVWLAGAPQQPAFRCSISPPKTAGRHGYQHSQPLKM